MKNSAVSQTIRLIKSSDIIKSFANIQVRGERFIFGEDNQYEIKIANTKELKEEAYKLIYKVYLDKNFIQPNAEEMWYSEHDFKESTTTLVVLEGETVVGALTIVFDDKKGLPAYSVFSDEMAQFSDDRETIFAEIVSLGIKEDVRGADEILIKLFNFSYLISHRICGVSDYVITVNPRHKTFYMKKLMFVLFGDTKEYEKVGGAPANLLRLDLTLGADYIADAKIGGALKRTLYKGFLTVEEEREVLLKLRKLLSSKNIANVYDDSLLFDDSMFASVV